MQDYNDAILYKTHQHIFLLVLKIFRIFIPVVILLVIVGLLLNFWGIIIFIILLSFIAISGWYYFFWSKSYFLISNEKIIVKVRNGIFSKFHMSIHYKNIRDTAFSKNNIFHYMFGYGTFFARSSAGAMGDLEAQNIPHIEKVYKIINALHSMEDTERKKIKSLEDILQLHLSSHERIERAVILETKAETLEQAIEKEKNILLSIKGIKEVVLLDGKNRKYIFEHEEDRNHGVYECLRRQVLFAATHDSTFRDPDEAIVMQAGEKVVFPVIEFHEIQRKKVSSSSPGLAIHEYLVSKFQDFDDYDATLLIGFDI